MEKARFEPPVFLPVLWIGFYAFFHYFTPPARQQKRFLFCCRLTLSGKRGGLWRFRAWRNGCASGSTGAAAEPLQQGMRDKIEQDGFH
ncbi:hypothetical protein [Pantoea agglomerans]|uniref:hypothetical protein n=1 Tax=Enterobacter agglomerans TaxID=549 RepID=UPI003C7D9597